MIKDHFMFQNIGHETLVQSALVAPKPQSSDREPRMNNENAKKYFVEDLGEDMLLVDSRKKNMTQDILDNNISVLQKGILRQKVMIKGNLINNIFTNKKFQIYWLSISTEHTRRKI